MLPPSPSVQLDSPRPRLRVGGPLLLAAALLVLPFPVHAGRLVNLDPQGVTEPNARDEAALENAFREAYGRDFPGYGQAARSPGTPEGAFVAFQKALILLTSDSRDLRQRLENNLERSGQSPWFDPDFPSTALSHREDGGTLLPTGYKITDENSDRYPPQLYAPSDDSLERIARLAREMERARLSRDVRTMERLQEDFLSVVRDEISEMASHAAGGERIVGLGVADRGGRMEPVVLDPAALDTGLGEIGAPVAAVPGGPGQITTRSQPAAVTAYLERQQERFTESKTRSEWDRFDLENDGGFHLRSSPDFRDGDVPPGDGSSRVLTNDLYRAHPLDAVGGGALNLDSRRRR